MPDSVVVSLSGQHLIFQKSEKIPVLDLAKKVNKNKSLEGKVFIEEEGKKATIEIGCPVCDLREQRAFVER